MCEHRLALAESSLASSRCPDCGLLLSRPAQNFQNAMGTSTFGGVVTRHVLHLLCVEFVLRVSGSKTSLAIGEVNLPSCCRVHYEFQPRASNARDYEIHSRQSLKTASCMTCSLRAVTVRPTATPNDPAINESLRECSSGVTPTALVLCLPSVKPSPRTHA